VVYIPTGATSANCAVAGSGRWRGLHPTFGLSRRVLAHAPRQTSGSATADSLSEMAHLGEKR
jgi:hypothetical protein